MNRRRRSTDEMPTQRHLGIAVLPLVAVACCVGWPLLVAAGGVALGATTAAGAGVLVFGVGALIAVRRSRRRACRPLRTQERKAVT